MTTITAKIIADSINRFGNRLTTLQLRYPRFIHPEFLTHREFSRNSQSNRAVSFEKVVEDVFLDPVVPIYWGKEQKGMMASEEVLEACHCIRDWLDARNYAIEYSSYLVNKGVHKQICNRLLEPFQHINTLVTSTSFENFFKLRLASDAEPHIQELARVIKEAIDISEPTELEESGWHVPYINPEWNSNELSWGDVLKISVARCARISYNNQGKEHPVEKEISFADKLLQNGHMSPFEHVASAGKIHIQYANFKGWQSYRNYLGY